MMKKTILLFLGALTLTTNFLFAQESQIVLNFSKPGSGQFLWGKEEIQLNFFSTPFPAHHFSISITGQGNTYKNVSYELFPGENDGYIGTYWTIDPSIPQDSIVTITGYAEGWDDNWNIFSNTISIDFIVHQPVINLQANPEKFSPIQTTSQLSYQFVPYGDQQANALISSYILNSELTPVYTFEENATKQQGTYTFTWDGKDSQGNILQDGTYIFQVKVQTGEKISTYQKSIILDSTGPQITSFSPSNGATGLIANCGVSASYSDVSGIDLSSFRFYLDNIDQTTNCNYDSSSFYWGQLITSYGSHTARIILKDTLGNTTDFSWTFSMEENGPTILGVNPPANSIVFFVWDISASYHDPSGINTAECLFYINGENRTSESYFSDSSFYYTGWVSEGTHNVQLILKDILGNTTDYTWSFTVQNLPQIWEIYPPDGSTNLPGNCGVFAHFWDEGSGINPSACQFFLDGIDKTAQSSFSSWDFSYNQPISGGNHTARLIIRDYAGNTTERIWSFHIEEQPPVISNISPPNGSTNLPANTVVSASFTDNNEINLSSSKFFLNDIDKTSEANWSWDSFSYTKTLSSGNYTAKLIIKDYALNTAEATWSFSVDTQPPQISSITPQDGATNVSPTSPITVSYSDSSGINIPECRFYLDGEDLTSLSSFTQNQFTYTQVLSETTHTANLIIKDLSGNTTNITWSFSVSQPPQLSVNPAPNSQNLSAIMWINGSWFDTSGINLSSFRFYLDGEDKTSNTWAWEGGFEYWGEGWWGPIMQKGIHTARVIVSDTAGNTTDFTWQFHIEEQPPEITNVSPADGSNNLPANTIISANYSDAISGIDPWMNPDSCRFFLDNVDKSLESYFSPSDFSYEQTLLKGNHTAKLIVKDLAGNEVEKTWSFHIEEDPPQITNIQPANGATVYDTVQTIVANFSDTNSGIDIWSDAVKLFFDGSDVTSSSSITENSISYTPSNISIGPHTVSLTVKDKAGNQTQLDWAFTYISTTTIKYYYDPVGNITRIDDATGTTYFTYDANNRITSVSNQLAAVNYTYDNAGNRSSLIYQVGNNPSITINYTYDSRNLLTQMTTPAGIVSFSYDEVGNLTRKDLPNGTYTTYSYDVRDRVTSITHQPFSRTISYTYDNAGNRLTMTDNTGTTNYSYDNIYQLIQVSYPGGQTINYTYDPAGNRVSDGTRTYTYNSLNQLVSSSDGIGYNYDGNGNLIQKNNSGEITNYQWNGFDKMVKVILPDNSEIGFIYGADGLRRKKVTGSGVVNYLLDGLSVLAEYDDSGNILRSYVPGISMSEGGNTYYYHYDGLGSVRFLTDGAGQIVQEYSYDAWGNLTGSTGSLAQPYQYVGEHYYYNEPNLGLQLLGQRWYDGKVGRFISRNSPYTFKNNNPIYEDPRTKVGIIPSSLSDDTRTEPKIPPHGFYGNWCGKGWSGGEYPAPGQTNWNIPAIDSIDQCCKEHDWCIQNTKGIWIQRIWRCSIKVCDCLDRIDSCDYDKQKKIYWVIWYALLCPAASAF